MRKLVCLFSLVLLIFTCAIPAGETTAKTNAKTPVFSLKKNSTILFVGGSKGVTAEGNKCSPQKFFSVNKYVSGFDNSKYDIKLKTSNKLVASVSSSKDRIYPKGIGSTEILVTVKDRKTKKQVFQDAIRVTVKKNASEEDLSVDGIEDGDEFELNESVFVEVPAGNDTDLRTLLCDDESVVIKKTKMENLYSVTFKSVGDFTIVAGTYQSEKYDGLILNHEVHVSVIGDVSEIWQTGSNEFKLQGGCVYDELIPDDIGIYYLMDGVKTFFSGIESVTVKDGIAKVSVFKDFEPHKVYSVICDGEELEFVSSGNSESDVTEIRIETDEVKSGGYADIKVGYYTADGINISRTVREALDSRVQFALATDDYGKAVISDNKIFFINPDSEVEIIATMDIFNEEYLIVGRLETVGRIHSKGATKIEPTGKIIYSFEPDDDKYLKKSDKPRQELAVGDNLAAEVLVEYSDGTYKGINTLDITSVVVADQRVVMIGEKNMTGGYNVFVNSIGETAILFYSGEEVVATVPVKVGEKRIPVDINVELSKEKLNTDSNVEDYILVKADVIDQYGDIIEDVDLNIVQSDVSKKSVGNVNFGKFTSGRLIINGSDCETGGKEGYIRATVSTGDISKEFFFKVKNVPFSYDKLKDYTYSLKLEGSKYIDTAVLPGDVEAESSYVSIVIESDGFFVGEDVGYILDRKPSVMDTSDYYGTEDGDCFYAMLIENKTSSGESYVVYDDACLIPSYNDLEFAPYTKNSQLPEGDYKVSVYLITTGSSHSNIELMDSVELVVFDSELEVEIVQLAETVTVKNGTPWVEVVKSYFEFYLDGEDITEYAVATDYNVSNSGTVYFKNVTFKYPNQVYGDYERTIEVGRLMSVITTD